MSEKKDSKKKGSNDDQKPSRTKRIINRIRGKASNQKRLIVVVDETHISAARPTKLPQINSDGLSHAGKHLLLLIQHSVDEKQVKVPAKGSASWEMLAIRNPDLVTKKNHIKELCNIHHFSPRELEDISSRVTDFVTAHQTHMVDM